MVQRQNSDAPSVLKAITWDERQMVWGFGGWYMDSRVTVYVEDEMGNSITFNTVTDFAAHPDIVIGDDMNAPGKDYIIGVIFGSGNPYTYARFGNTHDIVLEYWRITGAGTPGMTATHLNTDVLSTNATARPHIDMWTDSSTLINGWMPALHQFAAVWSEWTGNTEWELTGYYDDIDYTLPNVTTPFSILDAAGIFQRAFDPDVSCRSVRSNQGTKQVMDVVHTTPNTTFFIPTSPTLAAASLNYTEYDVIGGSTSNSLFLEQHTPYALGRIESMSQNNIALSPNAAQWQVCAIVNDLAMTAMGIGHVPKGYNQDAAGNLNTFYLHFPSDSMDHLHPAVSAGTGVNSFDPYTGMLNIGNQYYMCGYYPVGDDPDFYYTRDVDAATGSLATNNYYQINQNPLTIGLPNKALALSSSSNTGYCLLSAWSDGSDPVNIYYKLSPNGGVKYRPTPATTTQQIQYITLFPNPTETVLTLNGVAQTGEYAIFDITGKAALRGSASANRIEVATLPPGSYMLHFSQGKAAYHLKFIKK